MRVTRKELQKHLHKWQDLLRLRDWDIELRIVRTKWRKSGDIKIDLEEKKAVLLVNHRPYSDKSVNLEELVLHELLHVKLYGMDQMLLDLLGAVYGADEDDPKRSITDLQERRAARRKADVGFADYYDCHGKGAEHAGLGLTSRSVQQYINPPRIRFENEKQMAYDKQKSRL